jgi:hypothetical protein
MPPRFPVALPLPVKPPKRELPPPSRGLIPVGVENKPVVGEVSGLAPGVTGIPAGGGTMVGLGGVAPGGVGLTGGTATPVGGVAPGVVGFTGGIVAVGGKMPAWLVKLSGMPGILKGEPVKPV